MGIACRNDSRCEIRVCRRCGSHEMRAGYGDGGDGGGFGAEDAGAEGDGLPGVLGEEGDLFGGPAAFGADGEGVGDVEGRVICTLHDGL